MQRIISVTAFLLAASAVQAQPAPRVPDARQGAGLARDWCANCHVVGMEPGARGTDAVASFISVARDPKKGPDYVRRVLAGPHPPMPPMPLSRGAVDDLVAYFQVLAGTK